VSYNAVIQVIGSQGPQGPAGPKSPLVDGGNQAYATSSVAFDSQGQYASAFGTDIFHYVSGTQGLGPNASGRQVFALGGDMYSSGSGIFAQGLTGSITQLSNGNPFLVGMGNITVLTNSLGQIVVSGSGGTPTVTNVTGSGGTSVSNIGSIFTVSSSVGVLSVIPQGGLAASIAGSTLTVSGSAGVLSVVPHGGTSASITGTALTVSSSIVSVSGQGGTSVTNGGGTTFTVSSSAGVLSVVPQGGIAASITGTALTVSGSAGVLSVVSQGGTSASITGTALTVSSSVGVLSVIPQGGLVASIAGSALTVSGTVGVLGVVSQGGTHASIAGSMLTVSSSVGANAYSSYVVTNPDGENPNERSLVGRGSVQTIDNGSGNAFVLLVTGTLQDTGAGQLFTTSSIRSTTGLTGSLTQVSAGNPFLLPGTNVTLSANPAGQWTISAATGSGGGGGGGSGVDPYASYVVFSTTGSLANERTLAAGAGISLTDGGPGGLLTIGNTGGGSSGSWTTYVNLTGYYQYVPYDGPTDVIPSTVIVSGSDNSFSGVQYYMPTGTPFITVMSSTLPSSDVAVFMTGSYPGDGTTFNTLNPTLVYSDGTNMFSSFECPNGEYDLSVIKTVGGVYPHGGPMARYVSSLGGMNRYAYTTMPYIPMYGCMLNPQDNAASYISYPNTGAGNTDVFPYYPTDTLVWQHSPLSTSPYFLVGWMGQTQTGGSQTIVPEVFYPDPYSPGNAWISQQQSELIIRIGEAIVGPNALLTDSVTLPDTGNGTTTTLTVDMTAKISYSDGTASDVLGDSCYGKFSATFTSIGGAVTQLGTTTTLVPIANAASTSMADLVFTLSAAGTVVYLQTTSGTLIGTSSVIALQFKVTAEVN